MPLGRRIQGRAISLSDGGPDRGDAFRAKIATRSRFVLVLRATGRVAVARILAILIVASMSFDGTFRADARGTVGGRLVSPSPLACAHRVADGGDRGSLPASQGAPGFESSCQTDPRS